MSSNRLIACLLFAAALRAQAVSPHLAGRVVDEHGAPLAGVAVCLLDGRSTAFLTADLAQAPLAVTDRDGAYSATLPAPQDRGLGAARAPGRGGDDRLLFVGKGRVHVSTPLHPDDGWPVVLPRGRTLAGRVVDAGGKPLAGVRVEVRDWLRLARYRAEESRATWLPEPRTAARTDDRGRFVIAGTVEAGMQLIASDGATTVRRGPVALGEPIEIVLQGPPAPPTAVASGDAVPAPAARAAVPAAEPQRATVRAVDQHGKPIAAFRAAVLRHVRTADEYNLWQRFPGNATDSADGTAQPIVSRRGGDVCTALALAPGLAAASQRLQAGVLEATLQLLPEVPLRGKVVDGAGKPVAGARLFVCRGVDDGRLPIGYAVGNAAVTIVPGCGEARTDADGAFALPHIAAGPQHLFCVAEGFAPRRPQFVEPGAAGITDLRIVLPALRRIAGTTRLQAAPAEASVRLRKQDVQADAAGHSSAAEPDAAMRGRILADGSFRLLAVPPGTYLAQLVLGRPLQQGAPDVIDLREVTIDEATERLDLDLRPHLPARIRGTVRGPLPTGRLLVGASVPPSQITHFYGFASFQCPLATVAPDGAFEVRTPPGKCTVFVLDLLTGMLLRREEPRDLAAGAEASIDFDIVAGAVDVELRGLPSCTAWLEMMLPPEAWPNQIDAMNVSTHEYTKRIGCFLEPGAVHARLWLPPMAADLLLVASDHADLRGPRGEASIEAVAGKTSTVVIEFPR